MTSIATEGNVRELARHLADRIPRLAEHAESTGGWTDAVYEAFDEYSKARPGWSIYPETKAKKGEYLCDFMLFENGYGPRVACESQWRHSSYFGKHLGKLEWSFDKLRGVKADIKVFVFEGEDEEWRKVWQGYLTGYALLSPDEAFLFLQFDHKACRKSWWRPSKRGAYGDDEIKFEPLD